MENNFKITTPKYQQIAADMASKIAAGNYKVGEKIYARSSIASQYGVSSETARRAICVLSDLNIVESTKGSGVLITSYENAVTFINQYKEIETINDIKQDILSSAQRQKNELEYFSKCLSDLIERTDRFRSVNPFMPFQIDITNETLLLNKSISDLNFWQNTAATIVAIKRKESILMSPGPYAVLEEKDILFFVGDDDCYERVKNFIYPNH